MADDKIKILGQSAANIPRIIEARMSEIQTLAEGIEGVLTEDIYLNGELTQRFDKVEQQIRSFIEEAAEQFEGLHENCEEIRKVVGEVAENTSEGAQKISFALSNLTSEVASLDTNFQTETDRIEGALQELNRMHDEMEDITEKRLPILTDAFADVAANYNAAVNSTHQLTTELDQQNTQLRQEAENQNLLMKKGVADWSTKMEESVDLVTDNMAASLQEADARVVELLTNVDSFFEEEVVEPTNEKAQGFSSKAVNFRLILENSIDKVNRSSEWWDSTFQRIEEETNPLEALISKVRELARTFSQGVGF